MIAVRRLLFVGAVLAATSATAATALLGDQGSKSTTSQAAIPSNLGKLAERYAEAKFLEPQSGVHTYQAASGENFFALRLQPKLAVDAAPAPVDYAIVVDSTASQAGTPWQSAKLLAKLLTEKAGADDRIAISTVAGKLNSLTGGFVTVKDAKVSQSLKALDKVVPLGAADLKSAISATQASFDSSPNRQKVICYIGDGVSVLSPMRAADRQTLAANLLSKDVQFFAVPVGYNPEVLDLSGLATATGGAILRLAAGEAPESTAARFVKAMSAPVLRNVEVAYPNQVTLALPGKLPPLRSDVPTLVVGKLDGKVETLEVHCKGKLNGQSVSVTQTSSVQPSSPDCFFLPGMVRQWSQEKDAPALVRGDLALVFASTETSFAKEDLLTQASMAVQGDQFELAGKLFAEVARLDPKDAQAKAGIRLVSTLQNNPAGKAKMLNQEPGKQEDDFLKRSQQKSDVEAQRLKFAVEETLKQARKDLATNPEDALNRLKLLEQEIRSDPNIGEALRTNLRSQLEGEIRQSQIKAERFLAEAAEKEAVLSSARARESVARAREAQEERVRTSLAQFEALMARARYEESVIKADEIRAISRNLRPAYPSNVIGELAKDQSDFAYQQSQWDRIIAQKRANFLATMLTIDESSIPTPDEPPLYYPKPESFFFRGRRHRNWLELSDYRKNRWNPTYGDPNSIESVRIQSLLSKPTNKFDRRFNEPATLSDHIDFIQKVFGVTMVINTKAFQELDNSVRLEDINNAQLTIPRMPGVSLATILTYALTDLKKGEIPLNATYIIRGNYIEITTHDRAITERVARVYDVGTLVSSPAALSGIGGGGGGGFGGGGFGGGGGLGGGGLGGGGLGGGGLGGGGFGGGGLGGFGGGGFGGGGLGGFGGGGLGGGGLGGGGLGGGGLGGGGLGGGGLGGGGLGGGFGGGLGGGGGAAFSSLITRRFLATQLENLIRVIVTDADWDDPQDLAGGGGGFGGGGFGGGGFGGGAGGLGGGQGGGPGGGGLGAGGAQPIRGNPNKDQLFYYDPAFALVVKAPSNRTTRLPSPYKRRDDGAGAAAPAGPPGGPGQGLGFNDRNRGGDLAANQPAPPANQPARAADHASRLGNMMAAANTQDPRELWDHAIKNNGIDAGFAIAAVDFLTQWGKADHAAEFIKAALRHGVMPRAWMYEALAATLELSGGSPDEIEQALLSAADLKPSHADSLLQAAKAMGKHSKWQKALEFCRKSADLNPNHPQAYLHALKFAQEVQDAASMAWAAGNLISRDWPISEVNLHAQARQAAEKLAVTLSKDGREADAAKMLHGLDAHGRRDLVVKLTFQGEADLDLEATDPTGSTCNSLKRQSIGGGTLLSDLAGGQKTEIYSVAEAFPGQYKFTVRRMWGRTTGNKATLEIIQNKGSDQERIQRETIILDRDAGLTVDLKEGRRTTTASLTAPGVFRHLVQERRQSQKNDGGLAQLENLATPIIVGGDGKVQAIQGMAGIQAKSAEMQSLALMGETEVDLPEQGGVGYSTSIHSSADGKSLRVKVDPIFIKQNIIEKTLPVIPGSGS